MSCGPIPASAATSRGIGIGASSENVGAEDQSVSPVGAPGTTIAGPSENNAADVLAISPVGSPGSTTGN